MENIMKKRYVILLFCCIVFFLIILFACLMEKLDKKESITGYLKNKYGQEFIVKEQIKDVDNEGYLWAYSVCPSDNSNITFIAGQKKEKHISPLVLPVTNRVFYDNYFDEAKKYIISEVVSDKSFVLSGYTDLPVLSESIYTLMEEINNKLATLGFSTTKYTCSISLVINVNQEPQTINFYVLDYSKIYDLLYDSYYE